MEHRLQPKQIIRPHLESGKKELEIRVCDEKRKLVAIGDILVFDFGNQEYRRRVTAVRTYSSFDDMLNHEEPLRIMPGWSKDQVLDGLRNIYTKDKESLGVYVFELETAP